MKGRCGGFLTNELRVSRYELRFTIYTRVTSYRLYTSYELLLAARDMI